MSQPFTYPDEAARSRQGARRGHAGAARRRLGPLQGRRRRRDSVSHHPRRPACRPYFTRGSGHNERGQYSERPDDYQHNVDRLARKFETAKKYVPQPIVEDADAEIGIIGYGTSHWAIDESRDQLEARSRDQDRLHAICAPIRSPTKSRRSSRATRASTSSSRTATRRCGCCCGSTSARADQPRAQRPALQRPADRRALAHRRHPGAGREEGARSASRSLPVSRGAGA